MYWQNIKKLFLSINDAQSVRLEKGTNEFKNYFKQIPVPFKLYADFECNLNSVESYEGSCSKKYQDHIPCSFAYKLLGVNDWFNKAAYKFFEAILKEYECCKAIMKKRFIKSLIMTEEETEQF